MDAVGTAKEWCWKYDFVIDLDIRGLFDNIDHELLMRACKKHIAEKWVLLYIDRWVKAPFAKTDGGIVSRNSGTPQGGVISPILANLFMHYTFFYISNEGISLLENAGRLGLPIPSALKKVLAQLHKRAEDTAEEIEDNTKKNMK